MAILSSSKPLFETIRQAQVPVLDYAAYCKTRPLQQESIAIIRGVQHPLHVVDISRYLTSCYYCRSLPLLHKNFSQFVGTLDLSGICEGLIQG